MDKPSKLSDAQRRLRLAQWLDDHGGVIYRVIRSFERGPADRDDLGQEIAFALWESIPRFRGDSSAATWVYRVSLYTAMAWSKRERRHRDRAQPLLQSPTAPGTEEESEDPQLTWLYEQIGGLEELDRSLLLLVLEGLSYAEMATVLGITEENVGVKLHRIKKNLEQRAPKEDLA